eukprot:g2391.t1
MTKEKTLRYQAHNGDSPIPFFKRLWLSCGGWVRCGYSDEKWKALALDKNISWLTFFLVPLLILVNHGLFLYGQMAVMWQLDINYDIDINVDYNVATPTLGPIPSKSLLSGNFNKTMNKSWTQETFTLQESIEKLKVDGKSPMAALFLLLASGVWPHAKLLGLMLSFVLPLPGRVRQQILFYLDTFGKWSLADVMVVTIMAVGLEVPFHQDLSIPNTAVTKNLECLISGGVKMGVKPGIFVFCGAVILSLILSATVAAIVKEAAVMKLKEPKPAEKSKLEAFHRANPREPKHIPLITRSVLGRYSSFLPLLLIVALIFCWIAVYQSISKPSLLRKIGGYGGGLNRDIFSQSNTLDQWYSMWDIVKLVWSLGEGSQIHAITVFFFAIAAPLLRPAMLCLLWLMPMSLSMADTILLLCNFLGTFDAIWVYVIAVIIVGFEIPEISKSISPLKRTQTTHFNNKIQYLKDVCSGNKTFPIPSAIGKLENDLLAKAKKIDVLNLPTLVLDFEKRFNSTMWPNIVKDGCTNLKSLAPTLFGPKLTILQIDVHYNDWLLYYIAAGVFVIFASWWITFETSQYLYGSRYAEYPGFCLTCAHPKMYQEEEDESEEELLATVSGADSEEAHTPYVVPFQQSMALDSSGNPRRRRATNQSDCAQQVMEIM